MENLKEIFENLIKKKNLNLNQSKKLVNSIINNKINDIEISSILTLLNTKQESFEEIFSFVEYLKNKAKKINLHEELMDTCGTGGDNKNSFNFSTAVSILLSACDVKIAKHGNRSITSKSGSFDVLEALGIKIELNDSEQKKFFEKNGICFLFAPNYHPSLKKIGHIRKCLPFKTIFNLLGPLLNPANIKYQLLGVSNERNLYTHSKCLSFLKIKKAWVVFNLQGYDELTTTSQNLIVEIKENKISKVKKINPVDLGFKTHSQKDLRGGTAQENAFIMRRLFEGETGAIRDNVLLNTGAGLLIYNKVKNLRDGVELAKKNIDNGLGLKKLELLIKN